MGEEDLGRDYIVDLGVGVGFLAAGEGAGISIEYRRSIAGIGSRAELLAARIRVVVGSGVVACHQAVLAGLGATAGRTFVAMDGTWLWSVEE
jgi:hypothetical protein